MSKRTLDSFFSPPVKRVKHDVQTLTQTVSPPPNKNRDSNVTENTTLPIDATRAVTAKTSHATYPFPIADLPPDILETLNELLLTVSGREIKNQPHLDLLYFQPLIPQPTANELFHFLRSSLPFYRVKYTITRFGKSIDINTPRYTTVFGIDETSQFILDTYPSPEGKGQTNLTTRMVESTNRTKEVAPGKYKSCAVPPRPIPPCLQMLKTLTEALTNDTYNFVLVNYYSTGQDSISFHSDDERFLGDKPTIASFSLGARRDFLMKHKPPGVGPGNGNKGKISANGASTESTYPGTTQIKLALGSGDMILMQGETQRNWLHSIPKRSGKQNEADKGRINITMRKAMVPAGTENYYQYNVGSGPVHVWDDKLKEMRPLSDVKLRDI
ncbi:hypothetical protein LTS08_001093 [Lithohypha guttulata]|uniref:uncharacterized protein n=1 Tax=Lithohypha guttulata TaxID=1690604 RepID=UPI002DE0CC0A|nr:hypothetical protein LTR51_006295 [Lithohypha guttulata]KAK5106970.1 hypothetical protein LTS08_001093 [Lithohypha guttulata]